MQPTIIYRVRSPEPTPTCVYFNRYEHPTPKQPPCEIYIATNNNRNTAPAANTKSIERELRQIKDDLRELKQHQQRQQDHPILPTYYAIKQDYPSEATFVSAPLTSHDQQPSSSQNLTYYCKDCDSIIEQRAHVERSIHRPKTGITTYQDSYKRRSASPKPVGYVCYPVYSDRTQTLRELEKRISSASHVAHHCVPRTLASFENKHPTRR